jgi:hypothetical protein
MSGFNSNAMQRDRFIYRRAGRPAVVAQSYYNLSKSSQRTRVLEGGL